MSTEDDPRAGAPPSFSGLGGEQRFRAEVVRITSGADDTGGWLLALRGVLRELVELRRGLDGPLRRRLRALPAPAGGR